MLCEYYLIAKQFMKLFNYSITHVLSRVGFLHCKLQLKRDLPSIKLIVGYIAQTPLKNSIKFKYPKSSQMSSPLHTNYA